MIMTLDERLRNGQMTRREFFKLGGKGLAVGAAGMAGLSIVSTIGCNKSPAGPDIPVETDFIINVYNHMKGLDHTTSKKGYTNSKIQIYFSDLGIGGVSAQYLAARKPNMGARLATTTNGVLNIPTTNETTIDVYCFSYDGGAQESHFQEIMGQGPVLVNGRNGNWYRKNFDGRTPNNEYQNNFKTVFNDLNNALMNPFSVGSTSSQGGTVWSYGCRYLSAGDGNKSYTDHWVCVDDISLHSNPSEIQRVMMAEMWEALPRIDNIGGGPSQMLICNGDRLNSIGVNLIRFAYIMAE
jgi:hypothetical protein